MTGNTDIGTDTNDTVTISALVDSDIVPSGTTRDFGGSSNNWRDGDFSGTVTAGTFTGGLSGNVTASTGSSSFNNVTINGTLSATSLTGNADTATKLATARNIGGVSFDGSADINLPGVNAAGNQNTSGNAATSTQLRVTDDDTNTSYKILYSSAGGTGTDVDVKTDPGSLYYIPQQNKLGVVEVVCSTIGASGLCTFGTSSQNAYGARYVSNNNPSGGSDGDIWYKY